MKKNIIIEGVDKAPKLTKKEQTLLLGHAKKIVTGKDEGAIIVLGKAEEGCDASFHSNVNKGETLRLIKTVLSSSQFGLRFEEEESFEEMVADVKAQSDEVMKMVDVGKGYLKEASKYNLRALLFYILAGASIVAFELLNPSSWFLLGTFALVFIGFHYSDKSRTFYGQSKGISEAVGMVLKNKIKSILK